MKNKCSKSCEKIGEEIIRKAFSGDNAALCNIVSHYQNYVKKGIRKRGERYGLYNSEIPVDDISQIVWIKFVTKNIFGFTEME